MNSAQLQLHRLYTHSVLDTAPLPSSRHAGRLMLAALIAFLAVPLLGLLGGLLVLVALGSAAVVWAVVTVRMWWTGRTIRRSVGSTVSTLADPAP